MKLSYPAIFYPCEEKQGAFTVEVPDLPGCVSEGDSLAEAILMGTDAACGWILSEIEDGKEIPAASKIKKIKPEKGGFVSMLALDIDSYAEKYSEKMIRKNIAIPAWLNTLAENRGVNFSRTMQQALENEFAIA